MRKLAIVGLGAALLAGGAHAQSKPATAEQVADAIATCKAVTSPGTVDYRSLPSHGWNMVKKRGSGRSSARVLGLYEKEGSHALIIIGDEEIKNGACVVSTRLKETSDYGPTAQAVSAIIGMPNRADGFTYYWETDGKTIRLDPTGEKSAPIARFEISESRQENAE